MKILMILSLLGTALAVTIVNQTNGCYCFCNDIAKPEDQHTILFKENRDGKMFFDNRTLGLKFYESHIPGNKKENTVSLCNEINYEPEDILLDYMSAKMNCEGPLCDCNNKHLIGKYFFCCGYKSMKIFSDSELPGYKTNIIGNQVLVNIKWAQQLSDLSDAYGYSATLAEKEIIFGKSLMEAVKNLIIHCSTSKEKIKTIHTYYNYDNEYEEYGWED